MNSFQRTRFEDIKHFHTGCSVKTIGMIVAVEVVGLAYCCLRGGLELWSIVASEVKSIYYAATYLHLACRPNAQGVKSGSQAAISTFE